MAILKATTKYGAVAGRAAGNGASTAFLGIPYAKDPVGALRFAPPQAPEAWQGERDCTAFGLSPVAPARGPGNVNTPKGEACLNLNIWTPAASADEKLPVMFWIYGGGFQGGSNAAPEFNGEHLAEKGVVVVTVNYRCGALGFIALKELAERDGHTGNYGILDQIAALRWVHENIAAFGGDPDRVLVYGQSAGGISTRILLASPLAKGLFSRAVVESGGGLNEADLVRPAEELMEISQKCLDTLGLSFEDAMTMDADELNTKLCDAAREAVGGREIGVFQPCVDGHVLTEVPGVLISRGEYASDVDVICGTVAGDSSMFCRKVKEQIGENIPFLRGVSYSPSQSWGKRNAALGLKPIHTYYMERTQPPRPAGGPGGPHGGPGGPRPNGFGGFQYGMNCPHSSEIAYVFGTLTVRSDKYTDLDREISARMMAYWTNFAKTGDPNGDGLPEWPAYTADRPGTLHISDDGISFENVVDSPEAERFIDYTIRHPGMLVSLDLDK